jgi:hypothetical protein
MASRRIWRVFVPPRSRWLFGELIAEDPDNRFLLQDPKSYVTALLEVYKKNLSVVEKPFEGDTGFQAALDKVCLARPIRQIISSLQMWMLICFFRYFQACRAFINKNPAAADNNKSPELIALYVDQQLKKSNKESGDESMEEALNDSVGPQG